jgi:hypothetical protein
MSENHHVVTSYVEHKGANLRVANQKRVEEFEVLCNQICIDKTNYSFIPHNHLDRGLRSDLLIGLVLFVDDQKPVKYLFPSTVWQTPNQLFTNSAATGMCGTIRNFNTKPKTPRPALLRPVRNGMLGWLT